MLIESEISVAPPPRSTRSTPSISLPAPATQLTHQTRQRRPDLPPGIQNNEAIKDIKSGNNDETTTDTSENGTGTSGTDSDDDDNSDKSQADDDHDNRKGPLADTGLFFFFLGSFVLIFLSLLCILDLKSTNEGNFYSI
jgi:hypothetical protein